MRGLRAWLVSWLPSDGDPVIDDLIACNRYAYRRGMEEACWQRITAVGAERWQDVRQGQRRLAKKARVA